MCADTHTQAFSLLTSLVHIYQRYTKYSDPGWAGHCILCVTLLRTVITCGEQTKRAITERLGGSESTVRGATGHLCYFPYLAGPLGPFRDVVILLEAGRSFFLCSQMDVWFGEK